MSGVCCIFKCESILFGVSVVDICRMSKDALLAHSARQNPTGRPIRCALVRLRIVICLHHSVRM